MRKMILVLVLIIGLITSSVLACDDLNPIEFDSLGVPSIPTRESKGTGVFETWQTHPEDYYDYHRYMHGRMVSVVFEKDYEVTEAERVQFANFVFDTFGVYWQAYGGFPFESYTIAVIKGLSNTLNALPTGCDMSQLSTERVAHEMYHSWSGSAFRQDGERMWFMEGLTVYTAGRNQKMTSYERIMGDFYNGYQQYVQDGTDTPVGDYSSYSPDYDHYFTGWKGCMIAYLLDQKLSQSGNNIDQVARLLYMRFGLNFLGTATNAEIQSAFEEVSLQDFTEVFEKYLYDTEPLPVTGNFTWVCHDSPMIPMNGIWKGGKVSLYLQKYDVNSSIVVVTVNAKSYGAFLDPHYWDGISATDDLAGSHLQLSLDFSAPDKGSVTVDLPNGHFEENVALAFPADVLTGIFIPGIWKSDDGSIAFYLQKYEAGSAVAVIQYGGDYYAYLDPDYSDGRVSGSDLGGSGSSFDLEFTDTKSGKLEANLGSESISKAVSVAFKNIP